jgi:hypothetical protein
MKCPQCNNSLKEGQKFCNKCGMKIEARSAVLSTERFRSIPKRKLMFSIVLLIVAVVALVVRRNTLFIRFVAEHNLMSHFGLIYTVFTYGGYGVGILGLLLCFLWLRKEN